MKIEQCQKEICTLLLYIHVQIKIVASYTFSLLFKSIVCQFGIHFILRKIPFTNYARKIEKETVRVKERGYEQLQTSRVGIGECQCMIIIFYIYLQISTEEKS